MPMGRLLLKFSLLGLVLETVLADIRYLPHAEEITNEWLNCYWCNSRDPNCGKRVTDTILTNIKCPRPSKCIVYTDPYDDFYIHRGCSSTLDLNSMKLTQVAAQNGCIIQRNGATYCFCDFNLCNAAGMTDLNNDQRKRQRKFASQRKPFSDHNESSWDKVLNLELPLDSLETLPLENDDETLVARRPVTLSHSTYKMRIDSDVAKLVLGDALYRQRLVAESAHQGQMKIELSSPKAPVYENDMLEAYRFNRRNMFWTPMSKKPTKPTIIITTTLSWLQKLNEWQNKQRKIQTTSTTTTRKTVTTTKRPKTTMANQEHSDWLEKLAEKLSKEPVEIGADEELDDIPLQPRAKAVNVVHDTDFLCLHDGLFAHTSNCAQFIQCVDVGTMFERFYVMNCPQELFFNEAIGACDYHENVHCTTTSQNNLNNTNL